MRAGVMVELDCAEPWRALRLLRAEPALARVSLFGNRLHVLVAVAQKATRELLRDPITVGIWRQTLAMGLLGVGLLALGLWRFRWRI